MEFTLRILMHELEQAYGPVLVGGINVKRFCTDARMAKGGTAEETIIVLIDESAPDAADAAHAPCRLSVGTGASLQNADLALVCEASPIDVFAFVQGVLSRYRTWVQRMDASIIADEGLQRLFDLSEGFLLNNTIIVDPALKLLAYTKGIPCDDPVTVELIKHGYHTEENIRKFQLKRRFEVWAKKNGYIINDSKTICRYTSVAFSFKMQDSFSLIVVMMCNNEPLQPWLLDAFMMFIIRVAYYSKRDYSGETPSGSAVDAFMNDLISGELDDSEDIEERRRFLGIPADGPFCLFSVDIAPSQHMLSRIAVDIARATAPAKVVVHGTSIIVLCFSCHDNECAHACMHGTCPQHRSTVTQRLQQVLDEYELQAGRSSGFDNLAQLPNALNQARAALKSGRLSGRTNDGTAFARPAHIYSFDEYYFAYLVEKGLDGDRDLLAMLHSCRLLTRIREYDQAHNTDNYRFLSCYLLLERRTTAVAEEMHMHRNNVKYRVDRLEELFGVDTQDAQTRVELLIAYRIMAALER